MIQPLDIFCVRTRGIGGWVIRAALSSRRKRRFIFTNHNAPVFEDESGNLLVSQVEPPRTRTCTLNEFIQWLDAIKAQWFVCRPAIIEHISEYDPTAIDAIQRDGAKFWLAQEGHKYPLRDLWVLYRNQTLHWLKRIGLIHPDKVHVYCTEGVQIGLSLCRLNLNCLDEKIEFVHPGDVESGCRNKELIFVAGNRNLYNEVMGINADDLKARITGKNQKKEKVK